MIFIKAYVIAIVLATAFALMSQTKIFKRKRIGVILLGVSALTICIIAGARSELVGTDIRVYVTRLINVCENYNSFFSYIKHANTDLGFSILIYLGYIFKDINVVLFFVELAVVVPIYLYAYLEKEKKSLVVMVVVFLLTMFCSSLNIMRQSIAMAICILSYHYFIEKKYIQMFITYIIAILFHSTAVIFCVVYVISYIIYSKKIDYKLLYMMIIILISIVGVIFMDNIIALTSYSYHLDINVEGRFSVASLLKKIFWIVLSLFCIKFSSNKKDNFTSELSVSCMMFIMSFILSIAAIKLSGAGRLGYYFMNLGYFLFIPNFARYIKPKWIGNLGMIIVLFVLWWNMTAVENDSSQVYPYKSDIIEFLN